jgi:hypothetical protein
MMEGCLLNFARPFSPEFVMQHKINKEASAAQNNPMFGVTKSPETVAKLHK